MENFTVIGQMVNASNSTLVVESDGNRFIYKPRSGERPLWDFPDHTLHLRERAAYLVSEMLGWNVVPETTINEGPYGIGSFQKWIDAEPTTVDIFPPNTVPDGWLTIITGIDEEGHQVTLAHEDSERLMQIAVFDALVNNADRKALADLERLKSQTSGSELEELLTVTEIEALHERLDFLLNQQTMPSPSPNWPAVPWPVF